LDLIFEKLSAKFEEKKQKILAAQLHSTDTPTQITHMHRSTSKPPGNRMGWEALLLARQKSKEQDITVSSGPEAELAPVMELPGTRAMGQHFF
ncbi:Hypothetical predicted protein, partial [Pelobates cultripes]